MVSIITPTYNSEAYLEKCILSLLAQNSEEFEHIIVDGGSNDNTLEIIKKYEGKYRMRWISEPDNGMYDAIRKGFEMAQGDVFCWLNSDDMYMPWTIQTVNEIFKNKQVQWCQGLPAHFDVYGRQYMGRDFRFTACSNLIRKGLHDGQRLGCLQQESMFWRKDLYKSVGGINMQMKYAGDFHLWKAFAGQAELYSVNTILAGFRRHAEQKSADRNAYLAEVGNINLAQKMLKKVKGYKIIAMLAALKAKKYRINVADLGADC